MNAIPPCSASTQTAFEDAVIAAYAAGEPLPSLAARYHLAPTAIEALIARAVGDPTALQSASASQASLAEWQVGVTAPPYSPGPPPAHLVAASHRAPKKAGARSRQLVAVVVLTFGAASAAFIALPNVYAQVMGPELTAEKAAEQCRIKGRELARSVEEESGIGAFGTTVTIDDVTVDSVIRSGDKYQAMVTLHQLARNAYGSLRGKKTLGCVVSRLDGEEELYTTLVPLA